MSPATISVMVFYQNCVIYSDKIHDPYTSRSTREENSVRLVNGEPLIFGRNRDKGVVLDGFMPKIVDLSDSEKVSELKDFNLVIANPNKKEPTIDKEIARGHVNYVEVDLFTLLSTYKTFLANFEKRKPKIIEGVEYTVEEKINEIMSLIASQKKIRFTEIFQDAVSKVEILVML